MLTLTSMLQRATRLYGGRIAIVDPEGRFTWNDFVDRAARAAGVLESLGIRPGDRFGIKPPKFSSRIARIEKTRVEEIGAYPAGLERKFTEAKNTKFQRQLDEFSFVSSHLPCLPMAYV